jgi:serine/threonine protein kinase, bacterial
MYPAILPGTLLHQRYRLIGTLAQGALGWVYLAEDQKRVGELCILQELIPPEPTLDRLTALQDAFLQEAALLYELHHPQIPRFRVVFVHQERLFWVEEHIPGKSYRTHLAERQAQRVAFSEAEVVQLLWLLLPVLSYIHSRGVVHGNICPQTLILRDRDQLPVLIGFGTVQQIATKLGLGEGEPEAAVLGYLPVVAISDGYDDRSVDFYALAVTALVLLTGQPPQALYDEASQTWQWQQWATISPRFSSILRQLLLRRNKVRHFSAEQIARMLKPLLVESTQPQSEDAIEGVGESASETIALAPAENNPAVQPNPQTSEPTKQAKPTRVKPPRRGKKTNWKYPQSAALVGVCLALLTGVFAWEMLASVRREQAVKPSPKPTEVSRVSPSPSPTPGSTPQIAKPTPTPQRSLNPNEPAIQAALRDRRRELNISYDIFVDLVDETFYAKYPDLKGQRLTDNPQQAQLRVEWNAMAENLLDRLALLSQSSRTKLGKYSRTDYDRAISVAKQFNLSDRALQTLTNVRFRYLFPEQKQINLSSDKFSQVWYAVLDEQLNAIQSKTALETIQPGGQGGRSKSVLKPGQGKVHVAYLQQGQPIQLSLQAPTQSTQLSIYPPATTADTAPLLQNSTELTWSGTAPQTGYYEIVVTSSAPEAVGYQLRLQ